MKPWMMILIAIAIGLALLLPVTLWFIFNRGGEGRSLAQKQGIPYVAVMAHRGVSDLAPEETDPAYRLALEMGADYLEADIQRTADGVLVCFHDDLLTRTTDVATAFPGREKDTIDRFTYAELMMLDSGTWFNERSPSLARETFHELKVLTLDELIDIAESGENRPGLYLETKSAHRYPGIEKQILEALRARGWVESGDPNPGDESEPGAGLIEFNDIGPDSSKGTSEESEPVDIADGPARVILQSFEEESIAIMKKLAPRVPRVYLVDENTEKEKGGWAHLVAIARKHNAILGPSGYQGWPWKTGVAHQNGVLVHHYTINDGFYMRLLQFAGTDGIFTNRSDLALPILKRRKLQDIESYFRRIGY